MREIVAYGISYRASVLHSFSFSFTGLHGILYEDSESVSFLELDSSWVSFDTRVSNY